MRVRRIAILIDGGFFLKRLPKLVEPQFRTTAQQVADTARHLCKRHIQRLTHLSPDHLAPSGSSGSHISTGPRPVTESKSSPYNSKWGASAAFRPDSGSHLFQIVAQVLRIVEM